MCWIEPFIPLALVFIAVIMRKYQNGWRRGNELRDGWLLNKMVTYEGLRTNETVQYFRRNWPHLDVNKRHVEVHKKSSK